MQYSDNLNWKTKHSHKAEENFIRKTKHGDF